MMNSASNSPAINHPHMQRTPSQQRLGTGKPLDAISGGLSGHRISLTETPDQVVKHLNCLTAPNQTPREQYLKQIDSATHRSLDGEALKELLNNLALEKAAAEHPELKHNLILPIKWTVSTDSFVTDKTQYNAAFVFSMQKHEGMIQTNKYKSGDIEQWKDKNPIPVIKQFAETLKTLHQLGFIPIDSENNTFFFKDAPRILLGDFQHYTVKPDTKAEEYRNAAYEEIKQPFQDQLTEGNITENWNLPNNLAEYPAGYYKDLETEYLSEARESETAFSGPIKNIFTFLEDLQIIGENESKVEAYTFKALEEMMQHNKL